MQIAKKKFSDTDQAYFALLSGDNNPLHLDRNLARRLIFGRTIVHGIHTFLWVLNSFLEHFPRPMVLNKVLVNFNCEVAVDTWTHCFIKEKTEHSVKIEVKNAQQKTLTIHFSWHDEQEAAHHSLSKTALTELICQEKTQDEIMNSKGNIDLYLDTEQLTQHYPKVFQLCSHRQIAVLLAVSRLIGLECPGLHSILCGIDLQFTQTSAFLPKLFYEVLGFDAAFSLFRLQINGNYFHGTLKSFFRPKPYMQPATQQLKKFVSKNEFKQQKALIIGGSRGLGELTTKLLALGDAEVKFSYQLGQQDAEQIRQDILLFSDKTNYFHYDVLTKEQNILNSVIADWRPTHLYYFAAIFPYAGMKTNFCSELYLQFYDIFVLGFMKIFNYLKQMNALPQKIFYPSTTLIEQLPSDLSEFTAAKLMSEHICNFLKQYHKQIKILVPRLDKLATDQNVSLRPTTLNDPVPILLKELRILQET